MTLFTGAPLPSEQASESVRFAILPKGRQPRDMVVKLQLTHSAMDIAGIETT
jgi:hypothetical protein